MKLRALMQKQKGRYVDYTLIFVVLFLVAFGLIMIYSASAYDAAKQMDNEMHYLLRQGAASLLGIGAMFFVSLIPYQFWSRFAVLGYAVSALTVILVLTPLGVEANGARRWLNIGITTFQPAELVKLCMILLLAVLISKMGKNIRTLRGFLVLMAPVALICAMVLFITSNLSTAIIIMGIAILMVFVASPDYKKFIAIGVTLIVIAVFAVILIVYLDSKGVNLENFRLGRILAWIYPERYTSSKSFQTLQGLYAIGSGGIFGKGLGNSIQKLGYLPEQQNDMVFAVICEELGLFGAFAVILLFIVMLWRMMIIANNASDLMGAMLVVGVMSHIAIQVILNICVVTNTLPNTGVSLPFISYGGTSAAFLLVEMGLVLSVARGIKIQD